MAKAGMKLSGVGKLRKRFRDSRRNAKSSSAAVGYTANYALIVHEMVNATFQKLGAQAKFLEEPARRMEKELVKIVEDRLKQGDTLSQALYIAGLALQAESQRICPVDTGNMVNTAFTRIER